MAASPLSSYENNLGEQAAALERAVAVALNPDVDALDPSAYDRIILTGMGASDSAAIPLEYALSRRGLPVWRMPTSRLLDTPELVAGRTLLWIVSQSGRSAETVALLSRIPDRKATTIVAVTNDAQSPLAQAADHCVLLHSGAEATVSCKSYLNTLAWFHRIGARCRGESDADATRDILATASSLAALAAPDLLARISALASRVLEGPAPRLALVGTGTDSATALAGALIIKEAAKVTAEGYAGGAFRHGPIELAGPGLTALVFSGGSGDDVSMTRLVADLIRTGSTVVTITHMPYAGAEHIRITSRSEFDRLALGMGVVQRWSVALARAAGIVPGEFRFGSKVTSQI